jgi:hypothetical protein
MTDNDGFLSHIESQSSSEPFKVLSVDELMELMLLMDSSPPNLSEQILKILNKSYDTTRKSRRVSWAF